MRKNKKGKTRYLECTRCGGGQRIFQSAKDRFFEFMCKHCGFGNNEKIRGLA